MKSLFKIIAFSALITVSSILFSSCQYAGIGIEIGNGTNNYREATYYLCSRTWVEEWTDSYGDFHRQELRFYDNNMGEDYVLTVDRRGFRKESSYTFVWDWYDANYPNLVIRRSDKTNQITANMTNTWFNYGYSLVNLDEQITSKRGSSRLLDMLYTGNGKLEDGGTTNGFENSPYQITNAGIFEAFVLADHREKVKSYYIVMNDISFKAYDEWSEEWNNAGVYFRGDFNGNGYTLSDIDSKYGLFRAITGDAQAYDFTLTKAFSQTAMLAAYMTSSDGGNATLHDIIIDSTKND